MLALAAPASARQTSDFNYSFEQIWRTSIRLVAVDFRFPIQERDQDIGFFLFDYEDSGRTYHGSLELVRTMGPNDTPSVRVTVQVPQMPSYVERHVLDRLTRKLTEEYGQAPPNRRPEPPPVQDDDEEEAGDEEARADED